MPRERYRERDENLYATVDAYRLVENLEHCLQCGKCAGICPVASLSPSYNPRQIIRDVLAAAEVAGQRGDLALLLVRQLLHRVPGGHPLPPADDAAAVPGPRRSYGLKYIVPFKRFALRAREDGLTFAPGSQGTGEDHGIRGGIGHDSLAGGFRKGQGRVPGALRLTGSTQ